MADLLLSHGYFLYEDEGRHSRAYYGDADR